MNRSVCAGCKPYCNTPCCWFEHRHDFFIVADTNYIAFVYVQH